MLELVTSGRSVLIVSLLAGQSSAFAPMVLRQKGHQQQNGGPMDRLFNPLFYGVVRRWQILAQASCRGL
jgi:hypothetical protein